jgi:hypothetical protein
MNVTRDLSINVALGLGQATASLHCRAIDDAGLGINSAGSSD